MKKIIFSTFLFLFSASFVYAQFPKIYGKTSTSADELTAMATDANSNVYVTGTSNEPESDTYYIVTIKYNSSGNQQWVSTYSSGSLVKTRDITVDANGNVYVTGFIGSASQGNDFLTIKYNSSGVQQWVSTYNGNANGDDEATAIALDDAGNIYVTGYGYVNHSYGNNFDMITIAYNPNGTQKWRGPNIFDLYDPQFGTGHGDDYAYDIAIYNPGAFEGAIFICGKGWGSSQTLFDNVTVQIDFETGQPIPMILLIRYVTMPPEMFTLPGQAGVTELVLI